ncbi:hypothetical protein EVAR_58111_1 [Eumeta japonica]|uniref:Uncharacterized protein n=1 Tax=Eumeta variegata TaxID=151549 RepID=A0A4C1YQF6_EUMVA|nr:hypothetical protein EVAR_58111_1 [Eumeta japonica]
MEVYGLCLPIWEIGATRNPRPFAPSEIPPTPGAYEPPDECLASRHRPEFQRGSKPLGGGTRAAEMMLQRPGTGLTQVFYITVAGRPAPPALASARRPPTKGIFLLYLKNGRIENRKGGGGSEVKGVAFEPGGAGSDPAYGRIDRRARVEPNRSLRASEGTLSRLSRILPSHRRRRSLTVLRLR